MIPNLRGWRRTLSGDRITLVHPEGELVGAIRYRESVRPLAAMSAIVGDLIARAAEFRDPAVGPIQRGLTEEGEYTCRVAVSGTVRGDPARRHIAVVPADDDYALLTGVSRAPSRFDELASSVEPLLAKDAHGRGLRRRRYLYAAPAGWQGLARGLTTEWQPPD